ncbi:MAG: NAD kinase [Paludibacteraceae bacterium]|nr:NAD kinase [Paludibacteraceae bacterium]
MRIAIFANTRGPEIIAHITAIFNFFRNSANCILLEKTLFDFVRSHPDCCPEHTEVIEETKFEADLALSIGGDGTFLNTAARVGDKGIPVLGINTGRLGFLADVATENIIPALREVLTGNYHTEERTLLQVETSDGTSFENPFALNEISVLKQDSSSMISINAHLNSEAIHTYQADGLLISTPTGSTAYSLSVGGPIVVPQAQNFLLSPVASHSLNVRPLIVPDDWVIDLEVKSRSKCYQLSIDGRSVILNDNIKLRITKAPYTIKIVKVLNQTFFTTLKNKLMWGMDKRN